MLFAKQTTLAGRELTAFLFWFGFAEVLEMKTLGYLPEILSISFHVMGPI